LIIVLSINNRYQTQLGQRDPHLGQSSHAPRDHAG